MAEFVFRKGTERITFTKWEDVPSDLDFDHVIKFIPDVPPPPHTEKQHEEMDQWDGRLQKLMERERANDNIS